MRSDGMKVMTDSIIVSGEQSKSGEDRGADAKKKESLGIEGESLKGHPDKKKEGEGVNNVDNLKTRTKRQHSDTFISKNSMKVTKTVRELVDRYEGWGKESGTFGNAQEPFKFGQK